MEHEPKQNGQLALRLSEDHTLALATVYPSKNGGEPLTVPEITERLRNLGVTHGILDQSIKEAIDHAETTKSTTANVVVARVAVPENGTDARIQYQLPLDLLSKPVPKSAAIPGIVDWLALDPQKLVRAGQNLLSIVPAQPGVPGKTITWPIKLVPAKPGKPPIVRAGINVQVTDGTRMEAAADGCVCLHGDILSVTPLHLYDNLVQTTLSEECGIVVKGDVLQSRLKTDTFIMVGGSAIDCKLRADDDIVLTYAEGCDIVTRGSLFVISGLKNCRVTVRGDVITCPGSTIAGGSIDCGNSVDAVSLGDAESTTVKIRCGKDRFCEIRGREIQEEIHAHECSIKRIAQALNQFSTKSGQANLSDDKRALLHKLQMQKRSIETRISQLHMERRAVTFARTEKVAGCVRVHDTVWPGVLIELGDAATLVESPLKSVRFQQSANGKSVEVLPELQAAA